MCKEKICELRERIEEEMREEYLELTPSQLHAKMKELEASFRDEMELRIRYIVLKELILEQSDRSFFDEP